MRAAEFFLDVSKVPFRHLYNCMSCVTLGDTSHEGDSLKPVRGTRCVRGPVLGLWLRSRNGKVMLIRMCASNE